MTKENIWAENLEFGLKGEEALKETLNSILFACQIERMQYNNENLFTANLQRKAQREGINGTVEFRKAKWDVKLRKYFPYREDIAIETISVIEENKEGWFYYSKADWIIYAWADKHGVRIIDGYFIFLQKPELRKWFEENKDYYKNKYIKEREEKHGGNLGLLYVTTVKKETNEKWHTENIPIPINEFPENTIIKFDPNTKLDKQQKTFDELFQVLRERSGNTKSLAHWF